MGDRWRSWLREPLLHFLLVGLILFALLGRSEEGHPEGYSIRVDEDQIARLAANWERTWQRPPTEAELDRQIDNYVREEIYYREALRLGLDEDDVVIRRRLRAKMEFITRATIDAENPEDAVLQQWLDEHPALYAEDAVMSIEQVYLGADGDAAEIRAQLEAGGDPRALAADTRLPFSLTDASRARVVREFGEAFAAALDSEAIGDWQGPVRSSFGTHLVRINRFEAGELPPLGAVRQRVENDWRAATLAEREEQAYAYIRSAYSVEIASTD